MNLTQEQREQIVTEVKKFSSDLHLSPEQQEKLQTAFQAARGKLGDYMAEHPGVSRSDIAKELSSRRDDKRKHGQSDLAQAEAADAGEAAFHDQAPHTKR